MRVWIAVAAAALAIPAVASAGTVFLLDGRGWGHGVGMSQWGAEGYARHGFDYWQQTPDRRLVLGGRRDKNLDAEFTSEEALTEPIQAELEGFAAELAGAEARIEHRWPGIFGSTEDHLPLVGAVPGRDGVSVLREVGKPPPRVILMTAYAKERHLKEAREKAFAVVHKPFPVPQLLDLVASAARADT